MAPLTQGGVFGLARLMDEDLISIVQKTYDFSAMLYAAVNRFPRAQKALLGRELLRLALRLLVQLVRANRRRDKVPELEEASGTLDALRVTLRLAHRLAFLSHSGYEGLSRELSEIGRMLGGWLKQSAAARADIKDELPVRADAPTKPSRTAVRYRMTSPHVERYLKAKLESPQTIVFVKSGSLDTPRFGWSHGAGRGVTHGV